MNSKGTKWLDPGYLLQEQYRNASNLNARIQLHQQFSINKYGWFRWLFDRIQLPSESQILELGCGPGDLWKENRDRIPDGWEITLSDLSPGMVQRAQQHLTEGARRFEFKVIDAQNIPFEDGRFDAVIANHVLYHVPDRTKALSEIRRVLGPSGRFFTSTIGQAHMRELHDLVCRFVPTVEPPPQSFLLENGLDQLAPWFSKVALHRYEDGLVITSAEPLVAYVLSTRAKSALMGDILTGFVSFVERELETHGVIHITKDSGLFEAW